MNFYFEMAINILEVTLILSFLVQYFGYRIKYPAKYIWTIIIGLVSFCNIAFFSWNNLYESYASSLQILINIIFCCVLLCGPLLQKNICICIYYGTCSNYCNFYNSFDCKVI